MIQGMLCGDLYSIESVMIRDESRKAVHGVASRTSPYSRNHGFPELAPYGALTARTLEQNIKKAVTFRSTLPVRI
jgi:hypothetical protein